MDSACIYLCYPCYPWFKQPIPLNAQRLMSPSTILRTLGIEPRPFWALLSTFLLMDFRSPQFGKATGTKPKESISPLIWVIGQYLIIGCLASVMAFARSDAVFFAGFNLTISMLVVASAVFVEFHEVVFDPKDVEILGWQPIPPRTYSAARCANLLVYVLAMTAALNLYPAIVGCGLRDANWTFLPAYTCASFLLNLIAAGVVVLLFAVVRKAGPDDQTQQYLAWTQIVLILVLGYAAQFTILRKNEQFQMFAYQPPDWVWLLPSAWLAVWIDDVGPFGVGRLTWIPFSAIAATVALWSVVLAALSHRYATMQPGSSAWKSVDLPPLATAGSLAGPLSRCVVKSRVELAGYWLATTLFARDAELQLRSWPSLGVALAAVVMGVLTGQLADPITDASHGRILSLAALYLAAVPLPTLMHNLNYTRDYAASWLLEAAPLRDRWALVEGMRKAVLCRLMAPLFVLYFVIFAVQWRNPLHAGLHVLCGWLVLLAASHLSKAALSRGTPLSLPPQRGGTQGEVALLAAAVGGLAFLLALLHYSLVNSVQSLLAYIIILVTLLVVCRQASAMWLAAR